jgi:hypothetical protein
MGTLTLFMTLAASPDQMITEQDFHSRGLISFVVTYSVTF